MCFIMHGLRNLDKWNWDGDVIIHEPIVPSSRQIPDTKRTYPTDVREFLVSERNAIVQKTLRVDLKKYICESLPNGDYAFFTSRREKAFDYRAMVIASYVASHIRYKAKAGSDPWLFPDETLALRSGDCEDRALLLASLLLGSGISSFNVRVALGKLRYHKDGSSTVTSEHDHVWVMYKNEAGTWTVLEPLIMGRKSKTDSRSHQKRYDRAKERSLPSLDTTYAEYIPYFLFNDFHLWAVGKHATRYSNYIQRRAAWTKFQPKFAGKVHRTILDSALSGIADQRLIDFFNAKFITIRLKIPFLFSIDEKIDSYDSPFVQYDPYQHFDNAYITEGWKFVNDQLDLFEKDNRDYESFSKAAHAIADFYSHTSYAQFAAIEQTINRKNDFVKLFTPADLTNGQYLYTSSPYDMTRNDFSINTALYNDPNKQRILSLWNGQLVSGRYGQPSDSKRWLSKWELKAYASEVLCNIPASIKNEDALYRQRGSLPHHNEVAVDSEERDSLHVLYQDNENASRTDRNSFQNQFRWRVNSAIRHIRKTLVDNWDPQDQEIIANLTPLP